MSPQSPWQAMLMICERDLLLAYRRWDRVLQPVAFLVMVATLFPLALEPDAVFLRSVAPGLLWIAALLASLLALDFVFRADYEDGALEQLHAQLRFEIRDPLADDGFRDLQAFRRRTDTRCFDDMQERMKVVQAEPHRSTIANSDSSGQASHRIVRA